MKLLEVDRGVNLDMQRAGDAILFSVASDDDTEYWVVDDCGDARSLVGTYSSSDAAYGVAGQFVLSCDKRTFEIRRVDPTSSELSPVLFPSSLGCRVVGTRNGLATQEADGPRVWFHPNPADSAAERKIVSKQASTEHAGVSCGPISFECDLPGYREVLRDAGDDVLVLLDDGSLLAFSSTDYSKRIIDDGPVEGFAVLEDERHIAVTGDGALRIVDRLTGKALHFPGSPEEPVFLFDEWVVQGNAGPPSKPPRAPWPNFRALDVRSGELGPELDGMEIWTPLAGLNDDAIVVEVSAWDADAEQRYVVWPATGQRRRIDLPGLRIWRDPLGPGVFAADWIGLERPIRHLSGPDEQVQLVHDAAWIVYPNRTNRIVYETPRPWGPYSTPLHVLLPDGSSIMLENEILWAFKETFTDGDWPVELDDVVYVKADGDVATIRRLTLP